MSARVQYLKRSKTPNESIIKSGIIRRKQDRIFMKINTIDQGRIVRRIFRARRGIIII